MMQTSTILKIYSVFKSKFHAGKTTHLNGLHILYFKYPPRS